MPLALCIFSSASIPYSSHSPQAPTITMPFESSAVIGGMRLSRVAGIVGIAIYATVAIGFIAYGIYKVRTRHRRWTRAMGLRRTSYRFCKPLSQRPRTPSTPSNHKTHKKSVPPAVTYAQTYRPRPTRNRVENRVDQATGKEDKEKTKDDQASEGIHGRDEEVSIPVFSGSFEPGLLGISVYQHRGGSLTAMTAVEKTGQYSSCRHRIRSARSCRSPCPTSRRFDLVRPGWP